MCGNKYGYCPDLGNSYSFTVSEDSFVYLQFGGRANIAKKIAARKDHPRPLLKKGGELGCTIHGLYHLEHAPSQKAPNCTNHRMPCLSVVVSPTGYPVSR